VKLSDLEAKLPARMLAILKPALELAVSALPKRQILEYLIRWSLTVARQHGMSDADIADILHNANADHPD